MMSKVFCVTLATLSIVAVSVAGCATSPPSTDYRGVSVNDLVESVQCELRLGAFDGANIAKNLAKHGATAELELRLTDTSKLGASAVWVAPTGPEVLTASLGLNSDGSSARTAKLEFSVELKNLKNKTCGYGRTGLPAAPTGLGLSDWVRSAFHAAGQDDVAEISEATYKLEFTLKQGADGGISVLSSRFNSAMIGGAASREDKHTLTVTLARIAVPQPQQVKIVSWPAAGADRKPRSAAGGTVPFAVTPDGTSKFQFSRERLNRERPVNLLPVR
jgi:hypothetical protein